MAASCAGILRIMQSKAAKRESCAALDADFANLFRYMGKAANAGLAGAIVCAMADEYHSLGPLRAG